MITCKRALNCGVTGRVNEKLTRVVKVDNKADATRMVRDEFLKILDAEVGRSWDVASRVADAKASLVLTGTGDVLEPEMGLTVIGSGGSYALDAARALFDSDMSAETIALRAMAIAADICVFTNDKVIVETLDCPE